MYLNKDNKNTNPDLTTRKTFSISVSFSLNPKNPIPLSVSLFLSHIARSPLLHSLIPTIFFSSPMLTEPILAMAESQSPSLPHPLKPTSQSNTSRKKATAK